MIPSLRRNLRNTVFARFKIFPEFIQVSGPRIAAGHSHHGDILVGLTSVLFLGTVFFRSYLRSSSYFGTLFFLVGFVFFDAHASAAPVAALAAAQVAVDAIDVDVHTGRESVHHRECDLAVTFAGG